MGLMPKMWGAESTDSEPNGHPTAPENIQKKNQACATMLSADAHAIRFRFGGP